MRALRKIKFASLALVVIMFWVHGGLRVHAENYVADSKRPVTLAAPPDHFDALLVEMKDLISQSSAKTKAAPEKGFDGIEKLSALKASIEEEHKKSQEYFDSVQKLIEQKKLSDEILRCHREFVDQYESKYESLMENLGNIESAHGRATGFWGKLTGADKKVDWNQALVKTLAFLEKDTPPPAKSGIDPNNLPHRSLKADKPILPKLTSEEWNKAFPKESAKKSGPIKLGATSQPTSADFEETIEVKFTPEIRQLADSLGKNPVKIFNWVRNNIEFVPTWGSIQGAQLCLENRTGNAFDTASLLIALLRYSGIPARYQMGTIEVPIDKAMNWLGGFTNPQAAARFAASGGVPSAGTVEQGGVLRSIRMEHVWVNAYIDYNPSRGQMNIQGDTWITIDPTFKQNRIVTNLDISPLFSSVNTVISQVAQNVLINPSTGALTGIDVVPIHHALEQAKTQAGALAESTFPSGALVTDFLPTKKIISASFRQLAQQASYRILTKGISFSEIPENLRHRVTFTLADKSSGRDFSFSQPLPELSGRDITLSFPASSAADAQVIASQWEGARQTNNISSLPRSFPAQLIHVTARLRIGSQIVATGLPVSLGTEKSLRIHFDAPTIQTSDFESEILAGETVAIGVDPLQISEDQIGRMRQRIDSAAANLESGTLGNVPVASVTEDPLTSIIWAWFVQADMFAANSGSAAGLISVRYPSAGTCSSKLQSSSLFGAVSSVSPVGYLMDIDRDLFINIAKDGDNEKEFSFTFIQGAANSSFEGLIPDLLYPTNGVVASSGSTTSIFAESFRQGIPVYNISSANSASILPLLQVELDERSRIEDAVNAGKEVIIPQRRVSDNAPSARIVLDPQTGSAGFLINQQSNGYLRICQQCEGLQNDALIECITGTNIINPLNGGCLGNLILGVTLAALALIYAGATVGAILSELGLGAALEALLGATLREFIATLTARLSLFSLYRLATARRVIIASAAAAYAACGELVGTTLTGPPARGVSRLMAAIGAFYVCILDLITNIPSSLQQ